MGSTDEFAINWRENADIRVNRDYTPLELLSLQDVHLQSGFNEKVYAKMLLDSRLILVNFADKLCSAEIMSEFLPKNFLPVKTNVLQDANDLESIDLPDEFFLKVNHGSGGLIGVSSRAKTGKFLPEVGLLKEWPRFLISPDHFDKGRAIEHLNSWLGAKYRQESHYVREWCYSLIKPKMYVEQIVRDVNIIPPQMNIFCFHGKAMAFVYSDRRTDMKSFVRYIFLDNEGNFARICSRLSIGQWQTMIQASEAVSQYTDMVRVDWLLASDGPIFSELTNYPYGGGMKFNSTSTRTPQEVDKILSSYWGSINSY